MKWAPDVLPEDVAQFTTDDAVEILLADTKSGIELLARRLREVEAERDALVTALRDVAMCHPSSRAEDLARRWLQKLRY